MRVEADASDFAIEGMLLMKYEDEKQRPVTYIFKLLNKAERNYETHNKEMLDIIRYLEVQRHFLEYTKSQFKIWTNHKKLGVLYESSKIELKTGQMSLVFVKI